MTRVPGRSHNALIHCLVCYVETFVCVGQWPASFIALRRRKFYKNAKSENSCLVRNPGPSSFRKRYCAHVTGNRTSALTHMTQASIRPCPNFENSSSSPLCDLSRVYWFHLCVYINPWEFRLRCNQTENFLAVIRLFFKMPSRRDHRVTINSEIAK